MISNVVGIEPDEVRIGMKVEVIFEDRTEHISIPKFRPLPGKDESTLFQENL